MLILALELSTPVTGLALTDGTGEPYTLSWRDEGARHRHLYQTVPQAMEAAQTPPEAVGAVAVDLGPGSFSGIRIAVAYAQAFAIPTGIPVIGVPAADAIAARLHRETGTQDVTTVGDARRGRFWVQRLAVSEAGVQTTRPLELVPAERLGACLDNESVVATPEWERLGNRLRELVPPARLVDGGLPPDALAVADLARSRTADPDKPLAPLYLHPPVQPATTAT